MKKYPGYGNLTRRNSNLPGSYWENKVEASCLVS